jgi:hypothetical protein
MYFIPHSFICRSPDSTESEDAGIKPRTVATLELTVRRSNHNTRLDLIHNRLGLSLIHEWWMRFLMIYPLSSSLRTDSLKQPLHCHLHSNCHLNHTESNLLTLQKMKLVSFRMYDYSVIHDILKSSFLLSFPVYTFSLFTVH